MMCLFFDFSVGKEESTPCMFYSVGRVGIGFTADELNELTRSLRPYWKTTPPTGNRPNRRIRECPPNLAWTKEAPDVWIEPKNSRILQVYRYFNTKKIDPNTFLMLAVICSSKFSYEKFCSHSFFFILCYIRTILL